MNYQTVTRQGWLGRLGGAFKGMLFGALLVLLAGGLQFWNEGRTVRRDALLAEARKALVVLASSTPMTANEGRLVHVGGSARATAPVQDAEFGVELEALALRRRVEMYQWREKRHTREEKLAGGGTRTVTEYRYEGHWNDDAVDSSRFEQREGHGNPGPLPYRDHTWQAPQVQLGGFTLSPRAVSEIGGWRKLPVEQVQLPPNLAATLRPAGDWLITGADPDKPQIGDLRVRFEQVPAGEISVVARQQGGALVPYASEHGELLLVERGRVGSEAMLASEASSNSRVGWVLRGVGFVLAWIGFMMLFKPLTVFADVVPLLGRVAGFGVAVVAAVLSAGVSVLAIGSGWLFYRPWLLLLALAALAAAGFALWRRARAAQPPAAATVMPPPPPPPAGASSHE